MQETAGVVILNTPIPLTDDHVLSGLPIAFRIGRISFAIPLMSLSRYDAFCRLLPFMPTLMIWGKRVPFWEIMDMEGDSAELAEQIRNALNAFKTNFNLQAHTIDLAAMVMAIADPVDPEHALKVVSAWESANGAELPIPETARAEPGALRELLTKYLLHTIDLETCGTLLNKVREANIELKKKLVQLGEIIAGTRKMNTGTDADHQGGNQDSDLLWSRLQRKSITQRQRKP